MLPRSRNCRLPPARLRNGILRYEYSETDPAQLLCRPLGTQYVLSERIHWRDRSLRHRLARAQAESNISLTTGHAPLTDQPIRRAWWQVSEARSINRSGNPPPTSKNPRRNAPVSTQGSAVSA